MGRLGAAFDGMGALERSTAGLSPRGRNSALPARVFLANLAVLVLSALSGDGFLSWGWRVPFFVSILMVGVGLYIRLGILETPIFSRLLAENRIERAPVFEVIKRQPKSIILVALAKMGEMAPAYVYTVFVLTYGTTVLGSSRNLLLKRPQ